MANIKDSMEHLMTLDGAIGVSLVDGSSGMVLGEAGSGIDMELAAAGNSEVIRAKMKTMESLGIKGQIEDILITLSKAYHILRPLEEQKGLFLYLVLDKSKSNLALARRKVQSVEKVLEV